MTTSSLPAFREYVEGVDCMSRPSEAAGHTGQERCGAFFQRALGHDPSFALAHYQLAYLLSSGGSTQPELRAHMDGALRSLQRLSRRDARAWCWPGRPTSTAGTTRRWPPTGRCWPSTPTTGTSSTWPATCSSTGATGPAPPRTSRRCWGSSRTPSGRSTTWPSASPSPAAPGSCASWWTRLSGPAATPGRTAARHPGAGLARRPDRRRRPGAPGASPPGRHGGRPL